MTRGGPHRACMLLGDNNHVPGMSGIVNRKSKNLE